MAAPIELFRRLTTGVYVITAAHDRVSDGFTAAWVTPVAFDPLLLAVSVNPANATWRLIHVSRRFVLNVLKAGQQASAQHFGTQSGRDVDKLSGLNVLAASGAGTVLADSAAWLACSVEQIVPAGDHVVVIARATGGDVLDPAAVPLRYMETGEMDGSAALYPAAWPPAGSAGGGTPSE